MESAILTTKEIEYLIKDAKGDKIIKFFIFIIFASFGGGWFYLVTNKFTSFENLFGEPFFLFFNLILFILTFVLPLISLFHNNKKVNILKNGFYKAYLVDVLDKKTRRGNGDNNSYKYYITISFGGEIKEISTDERNYFFLGKGVKALLIQYDDNDFSIYSRNFLKSLIEGKTKY